jgi:hypothetical protein
MFARVSARGSSRDVPASLEYGCLIIQATHLARDVPALLAQVQFGGRSAEPGQRAGLFNAVTAQ